MNMISKKWKYVLNTTSNSIPVSEKFSYHNLSSYQEEFEDTKEVIRIRKSKDSQRNGQRDKQWSTKHYTENWISKNTNSTKTGGELNQVLRKDKQVLLH
jgi:hypothetical protein